MNSFEPVKAPQPRGFFLSKKVFVLNKKTRTLFLSGDGNIRHISLTSQKKGVSYDFYI